VSCATFDLGAWLSTVIYGLCAVTALLCAGLLLSAYGRTRYRLLLWSGLYCVGLTASNMLLVLDKSVWPALTCPSGTTASR
jgi:hypothetical protein